MTVDAGPPEEPRFDRKEFLKRAAVGMVSLGGVSLIAGRWALPYLSVSRYAAFAVDDLQATLGDSPMLRVGFSLTDLESREVLFSWNDESRFCCGSNRKLYLIAAALLRFGSGDRFATTVFSSNPSQGGILNGPLYLRGAGDPLLTARDLGELALSLKRAGVRHITGPVIGDGTLFTRRRLYGADASPGDSPCDREAGFYSRELSGQVAGLSVDRGGKTVYAVPAERAGLPPVVIFKDGNAGFKIENRAVTTHELTDCRIYRCPGTACLRVEGMVGIEDLEVTVAGVSDPAAQAAQVLRKALVEAGITVGGEAISGVVPKLVLARPPLAEYRGAPLSEYVARMGKLSDSLVAESVLRRLGVSRCGVGGVAEGLMEEADVLRGSGIHRPSFVDGSGLDPANCASPREICALLARVAGLREDFAASLAVCGERGTLEERLTEPSSLGRVRAKTGTLLDTNCLSGFMRSKSGRQFAFSVMVDGVESASLQKVRPAIDRCIGQIIAAT